MMKPDSIEPAPDEKYVDPVIEVYKKDIDRTLIRANLKLTVEERFENLMQMQKFALEMRNAMLRAQSAKQ
jgi:hypothetical protein